MTPPRLLPDIGHVDFLEAVHGLAERPYVIVGLHFDQVRSGAGRFFQSFYRNRPTASVTVVTVGS